MGKKVDYANLARANFGVRVIGADSNHPKGVLGFSAKKPEPQSDVSSEFHLGNSISEVKDAR